MKTPQKEQEKSQKSLPAKKKSVSEMISDNIRNLGKITIDEAIKKDQIKK